MADSLASVAEWVPWMQERAERLDRDAAFPTEEFTRLRQAGLLKLPLPVSGRGSADELATLLTLLGRGNLSVGAPDGS